MPLNATPSLLSIILCFGLGLFVISRNPKRLVNLSFCLSMLALLIQEIGGFMLLISDALNSLVFWKKLSLSGEALIPGSWLLFSITFARKEYREVVSKWLLLIVAFFILPVGALSFLGSELFIKIALIEGNSNAVSFQLGTVGYLFYIFTLVGLVGTLMNLESTLRSSSWEKRWKIKFMILGFGGIAAFLLYSTSQTILYSSINLQLIPITSTIIVAGGMLILFSVVRFRLLDVDVFVSRYVVYRSLTILIVGIYLLAVGLLYEGAEYFESRWNPFFGSLILFFTALLLVFVFLSEGLRRKAKFFINRHFYKHKYEFRDKWMEVTEKIASKADMHDIQFSLLDLISETLGTREVSLWLHDEKRQGYFMSIAKKIEDSKIKIDQSNSLIEYLSNIESIFDVATKDVDEKHANIYNENNDLFKRTNASLCVPLIVEKRLIGFMTVGNEITGEEYVTDDYNLLKAVAKQAAIGILNAKLTEDITVSKEMEAFSSISSFIMHDLKNATSMLSLLAQNAPENIDNLEFQKDLIDTISNTTSKMKGLISRLSTVPREFELNKEAVNIKVFIEDTLDGFNPNSNKLVTVSVLEKTKIPEIMVDNERFRNVIINLVLNAYESFHGEGEIKIMLTSEDGNVVISFADNGPGIPEDFLKNSLFKPFKTMKEGGLGIGLFQIKQIVESHGGRIEVESEEGNGTTFKVLLPIG